MAPSQILICEGKKKRPLARWIGQKKSLALSVQVLQNQPALDGPLWFHNSSRATFQQNP